MDILERDDEFRYRLLGRLQSDCEYYLGFGNRDVNRLWARDEKDQIKTMKDLHNSFDVKPEFLTWEGILEYERKMLEPIKEEEMDRYKHEGGHHWINTHEATDNEKFLFFMVKCLNCGLIGKRKDLQSPIARYGRYADAKYEKCKRLG